LKGSILTSYKISFDPDPTDADIRTVKQHLMDFNNQHAEPEHYQRLVLFVRDDSEEIAGGLLGYTHWRWLFVQNLWVAESLRGLGYGRKLLQFAEGEARRRGCEHAYLDTFDFQARGFYEKLGYELFGQLEEYPPGHTKYFLQKRRLIDDGSSEIQGD
jgi:GNAT superfamily N-acetyltransferase